MNSIMQLIALHWPSRLKTVQKVPTHYYRISILVTIVI